MQVIRIFFYKHVQTAEDQEACKMPIEVTSSLRVHETDLRNSDYLFR